MSTQASLPHCETAELRRDLSQFYTPPVLAERLWKWATYRHGVRSVLEPSAGQGALLKPVLAEARSIRVTAVEADPENVRLLRPLSSNGPVTVLSGDFLAHTFLGERFDLALMNPPFERNQAMRFALHALTFSERVCGIFPASIFYSRERQLLWSECEPTRIVHLSRRPRFGGHCGAQTDFVLLELVRRTGDGLAQPAVEWW